MKIIEIIKFIHTQQFILLKPIHQQYISWQIVKFNFTFANEIKFTQLTKSFN